VKFILLDQAQADLDAIDDPSLKRFARRLEAFQQFPDLGAPMNSPFIGFRSTLVDFFRIVYRVRDGEVLEILFIRVCRRRLPKRP
jgi:hypothetical protein